MSTPDQLLYSTHHGTAMRYAAERGNLDESIEELHDIADGRATTSWPKPQESPRDRGTPGPPLTSIMS
jgi:hypothetical protein